MPKKSKTPHYLDLPYASACGCKLEVIDGGLRTLFTRCPLHAAAPDLLAALSSLMRFARADRMPDRNTMLTAEAAIRKAEGGKP